MIKKLSLKFVLVSLVLVVSVIITSSCYAFSTEYIAKSPVTIEDLKEASGKTFSEDTIFHVIGYQSTSSGKYKIYLLYQAAGGTLESAEYFAPRTYNSAYYISCYYAGNYITLNYVEFSYTDGVLDCATASGSSVQGNAFGYLANVSTWVVCDITTLPVRTAANGTVIYEPLIAPDTSFEYSLTGIKRGQVKLEISNLDESLRMYGYVGLETTYAVNDTLDITANTSNLRLLASMSDNSDLNCYLYEGEELNYYIVDENNVILDTGYISEMAKGDFLYGFEVNNGVDFVFLRYGQVYWDNTLTFKYSLKNSNLLQNNTIVSMGSSSYIETDKTIASNTYTGYVYDSDGNLLSEAQSSFSNDLSSLSIKVDTSYSEVETLLKNYSCYWLQTIYLTGNDSNGNSIDFSDYYVTWSVPTWVNFYKIELSSEEYTKRSGTLTGFTSEGVLSMFNLKFYEYLSEHIKSFDVTLQVYDSNDSLVLTHVINSDDIVRNQIASEENNIDKGDYDILDNPNYTGGSSGAPDINNIQNWTADDYVSLMNTDNFVWEFFKAILGNLPWWITTPLTILIFGVVIITLIRFARGA